MARSVEIHLTAIGLTLDEYRARIGAQERRCAACGRHRPDATVWKLDAAGGLVCSPCARVLTLIPTDERLSAIAAYAARIQVN